MNVPWFLVGSSFGMLLFYSQMEAFSPTFRIDRVQTEAITKRNIDTGSLFCSL